MHGTNTVIKQPRCTEAAGIATCACLCENFNVLKTDVNFFMSNIVSVLQRAPDHVLGFNSGSYGDDCTGAELAFGEGEGFITAIYFQCLFYFSL